MMLELALVGRPSQQPFIQGGHNFPCFEFILVARGGQCRIDFMSIGQQGLCYIPSDDAVPLLFVSGNGSDYLLDKGSTAAFGGQAPPECNVWIRSFKM